MNDNLLGAKVKVTNPIRDHEWLKDEEGIIVQVNNERFRYTVRFERGRETIFSRMIRGEFEEVTE